MKVYALVSVWNKTGIESMARALVDRGYTLLSTGNTSSHLRRAGFDVEDVSHVTGEPERFGGRVKTLHHKILGGILMRPDKDESEWPFDFRIGAVVCNFYPFNEKVETCQNLQEVAEWIDIGGPTMVRAAAKNYSHVFVITNPEQYARFIGAPDDASDALKIRFALQAFQEVCQLDESIEKHWTWRNVQKSYNGDLKYGENPHQKARFIMRSDSGTRMHGDFSYNNIKDAEAALRFVREFSGPAVSVIKHQTLCGAAVGVSTADLFKVFNWAWEGDVVSRYGGVLAFNFLPPKDVTEILEKKFIELVLIPRLPESQDWVERMGRSKESLRIIEYNFEGRSDEGHFWEEWEGRLGRLEQESDSLRGSYDVNDTNALLGKVGVWAASCSKSNAMVLCGQNEGIVFMAGAGQGQPNRVDALSRLAIPRAKEFCERCEADYSKLVCFSDAFLPFADSIEVLKEAGLSSLVQPGGSKRDEEVKARAQELGVSMEIVPGRHFWH